MSRGGDPAGDVAAAVLEELADPPASALVVDDASDVAAAALTAAGTRVSRWQRRAGSPEPRAWPPEVEVEAAAVRLPKGREALRMTLHATVSRVRVGGRVWLYGHNAEGIRSAGDDLALLCDEVVTREARRHCRVWVGRRGAAELRPRLEQWQEDCAIELPLGTESLVSTPGLFAHGRLDPASRLLAQHLPVLPEGARAIDFGCGAGALSRALLQTASNVQLHVMDVDALALAAAKQNLPAAHASLAGSLGELPPDLRLDLIFSNPPFHEGKSRDTSTLERLLVEAPARLTPRGELRLVAQRTIPLGRWLARGFQRVERLAETRSFHVWCAATPRAAGEPPARRGGRTSRAQRTGTKRSRASERSRSRSSRRDTDRGTVD